MRGIKTLQDVLENNHWKLIRLRITPPPTFVIFLQEHTPKCFIPYINHARTGHLIRNSYTSVHSCDHPVNQSGGSNTKHKFMQIPKSFNQRLHQISEWVCCYHTGWFEYFRNCWPPGIFHTQPSLEFTQNVASGKASQTLKWMTYDNSRPHSCQEEQESEVTVGTGHVTGWLDNGMNGQVCRYPQ